MTYLGGGRGDYIQETTYRYVGRGAGEFGVNESAGQSFGGWFFLRFLVIVGSAALLLALIFMWPQPLTTTTQPFDCEAGAANWQLAWSVDKQQWCCQTQGRGCSTTPPAGLFHFSTPPAPPAPPSTRPSTTEATTKPPAPPSTAATTVAAPRAMLATTRAPHDCRSGALDVWSEAKKEWCCLHTKIGCPTLAPPATPPPSKPFDCDAGVANWQHGWSIEKKEWCCTSVGRGCAPTGDVETTAQTTSAPFDCIAGFADWQAVWSEGKKAWCCEQFSRGCPAHDHELLHERQ